MQYDTKKQTKTIEKRVAKKAASAALILLAPSLLLVARSIARFQRVHQIAARGLIGARLNKAALRLWRSRR